MGVVVYVVSCGGIIRNARVGRDVQFSSLKLRIAFTGFLTIRGSYLKCSLIPLERSNHSNMPKNKVRRRVMLAEDTEAPKTVSA